jgi:hypothetical protein
MPAFLKRTQSSALFRFRSSRDPKQVESIFSGALDHATLHQHDLSKARANITHTQKVAWHDQREMYVRELTSIWHHRRPFGACVSRACACGVRARIHRCKTGGGGMRQTRSRVRLILHLLAPFSRWPPPPRDFGQSRECFVGS